ncbi:hypothetical protein [uncultured Parolsenella sp.]|uniref:hypothetical protein n=1 Tax=uncultured Parolsenella sp. TaxID=2083008 RepID=UPI0027D963B2|nr:hypothetical protein [uncultured Parolsenella sp.]
MPRKAEPTSLRSLATAAAPQPPEEHQTLEKPATVAASPVISELWELYAGSGMSYKPEDAPQTERLVTYVSMWLECREHCYDGEGRVIALDKLEDWPMVYILANDKEAYVGQTTSVARRMAQHGANPEKQSFTSGNIIFNSEFDASVITDYERRLIQYMHGNGRYRLTNKNDGMTDTNCFSKSRYSEMFEDLWGDLRQCDLAEKTLKEIEESDVLKYSPFKGLNLDQQLALDEILTAIGECAVSSRPLVVEGMPGTGKTVLAVYLLKRLKDDERFHGLNIRLMEPATALRKTL